MASRALDPTEVFPGPQPVESAVADGHRIIVGEVLTGRHRAPRTRTVVGSAVLAATGVVAGLSMLLSQGSTKTSAQRHAPAKAAPDQATDVTAEEAPARTSIVTPAPEPSPSATRPAARSQAGAPAAPASLAAPRHPAGNPADPHQRPLGQAEAWLRALQRAAEREQHDGHWHGPTDAWHPGGPDWHSGEGDSSE